MELQQHHLPFAQRQSRKRIADSRTTLDVLERLSAVAIGGQLILQLIPWLASPSTQLIERGVASDREQPGPRGTPAMVQTRTRAIETLERQRGHVLSRDSVAEQRDRIRVHVGAALPEERLEGFRVEGAGPRSSDGGLGMLIRRGHRSAHHPNYVQGRGFITDRVSRVV